MNLRVTLYATLALSGLALLSFGLSDSLNAALGMRESILGKPWQLLALAGGSGLLLGLAWPWIRGVKAGDRLVALARKEPGLAQAWLEGLWATALEPGRTGARIRVKLSNGSMGEGVVLRYAGLFSPALLHLLEAELQRPPTHSSEGQTEF